MKNIVFINGSPKRSGATDEFLSILISYLNKKLFSHRTVNLSDYSINYCSGCKICYQNGECVQDDGMDEIMREIDKADIIVTISPSYWGDITGQLKVFIDRCTPYSNTHELHGILSEGKKGYALALRTGQNPSECLHIIESINHFYGHLEIDFEDNSNIYLCGIKKPEDVHKYKNKIKQFADLIAVTA